MNIKAEWHWIDSDTRVLNVVGDMVLTTSMRGESNTVFVPGSHVQKTDEIKPSGDGYIGKYIIVPWGRSEDAKS